MSTPQDPQDPPFPFPAPFPLPDPDAPPDPDGDDPKPDPRPSVARDVRSDPQPGDEVRVGRQLRSVIRREGNTQSDFGKRRATRPGGPHHNDALVSNIETSRSVGPVNSY